MASITVTTSDMVITLTPLEKFFGLRGDVRVPRAALTAARLVSNPYDAVTGVRAPGLSVPGLIRIGTWRRPGRKLFIIGRRGCPGIHFTLRGHRYTDLVVSTPQGAAILGDLGGHFASSSHSRFSEEDVRFTAGSLELAGTFTTPASDSVGAVLILPGSGEVDRHSDHRRFPLGISRNLAHDLARRGLASLRYDKRGVGESGGEFLKTGFHDNTADAEAALAELRRLVPGLPLFVVGHSEGGMHAALVAANHPELAGLILLATPATTGEVTMRWQAGRIAVGLPPLTKMLLKLLRIDILSQQDKTIAKIKATTTDVARMQGKRFNAKWPRELMANNPEDALQRVTMPVLAITGDKDIQVNPDDLEIIRQTVQGPVDTRRPKNLTHLLRNDPEIPSVTAYKRLAKQPTEPEVLSSVGEWVSARATSLAADVGNGIRTN